MKFFLLEGALVPWEFLEIFCLFVLQKNLVSDETVTSSD